MLRDGLFAIIILGALYAALVQLPALAIMLEVSNTLGEAIEEQAR